MASASSRCPWARATCPLGLAEEDDIRLEDATARLARRDDEVREAQMVVDVGIAVRQTGAVQLDPSRVEVDQLVLEIGAPTGGRAGHAADQVKPPMEVSQPYFPQPDAAGRRSG
jgi:hypothetical protein